MTTSWLGSGIRSSARGAATTRRCSTKSSASMFSVLRSPWRKLFVALFAKSSAALPSLRLRCAGIPRKAILPRHLELLRAKPPNHQSLRGRFTLTRERWAELLFPANPPRHLHPHKQREDRSNRHRQSREPFEEKCVRKQHQVDQLRQSRIHHREAQIHHQPEVTDYQRNRNERRNHERQMNRNMIRQIRQQQMKRKERAGQEKIVHRVQIVAAQHGQDEYQKEKKEQRAEPEIANPSPHRPPLQLLRHLQGDVESGNQILIIPLQLPAFRPPPFFRRPK